ncbi:MAG TPA: undecaprenyldiphospho-muramoylpentapeptide beta-N-acetylglucosaminyltransferase [Vicinamibacterales bacterium]|nr:undecaprenyldiphospho-muramoylpentapeptide beta-N-acetylglucosaminyltransferase [Vicinamibacterales bacterium]
MTLLIAGGGTGGHLYPGIAVARELLRRMPDARVSFVGTARGLEARVVPREGFELDLIRSAGLKGKSLIARARGAALVPVGFAEAWRIIARRRPDVVMGVGGFSSGPVVMSAAMRRVPTMVLEQNAMPGLTNRLLAPWVRAAAVTYEQTLSFFGQRGFVSGNPVREAFFRPPSPAGFGGPSPRGFGGPAPAGTSGRLLVVGGSQGAHAINVAMTAAAARIFQRQPALSLVHQTGPRDLAMVRQQYERAGIRARAEAFFDEMADEMAAADLVISRAGATTLAELAAAGRPALLVPFPAATDDHQRRNADVLVRAGAAAMIEERHLSADRLAETAAELLADPERRDRMSAAMRTFARPDAASRIVDRLIELARRPGRHAA